VRVWFFLQILLISALGAIILAPSQSHAQSASGIYFNELMWRGSEVSTSDEWIELYNDSDEVVDLSGWRISDEVKAETMLEITSGQIAAHDYFLISNNSMAHVFSTGESILDIEPDIVNSAVSLSNEHLKLTLKDTSGEIVDYAGNGEKPFFGEFNGSIASMQRTVFEEGTLGANWKATETKENLDPASTSFATPQSSGAPKIQSVDLKNNSFEVGSDFVLQFSYLVSDTQNDLADIRVDLQSSGGNIASQIKIFGEDEFVFKNTGDCPKVIISFVDLKGLIAQQAYNLICYQNSNQIKFSEVLPHPLEVDWNNDGTKNTKDEWMELVNFSDVEVDLGGWVIKDESGKSFTIKNQTIDAQSFLIIYGSTSQISINDSGEILYLLDPSGEMVDLLKIPSASSKQDESFALWGDRWHFTNTPTPGEVNLIYQSSLSKSLDPQDDIEGKKIIINGTIIDIDRTTICLRVSGQIIEIRLKDDVSFLSAGQFVTVNATITNNSSPILVAASSDFKIKNSSPVSSTDQNVSPGQISESQTIIIKQIIKRNAKISLKSKYRLKPLVLSSQIEAGSVSVNYQRFLLLFIGILSFMIIILLYDFCCRE